MYALFLSIVRICYLLKAILFNKAKRPQARRIGRVVGVMAMMSDSFYSSFQDYEIIILSFCFANRCMSILLLEQSQIDRILLRKQGSPAHTQNQIKIQPITHQHHSYSSRNNPGFLSTNYAPSQAAFSSTFLLSDHLSKCQSALNIRMNKRRQQAKVTLLPLCSQQTPFKVANPRCLLQLATKINAVTAAMRMEMVKVAFCMSTGSIVLQLPMLLSPWSNQPTRSWQDNSTIQYIYKHYVRNTLPLIDHILQLVKQPTTLTRYDYPGKLKHLQNVSKYAQMVNVSSHIAQGSNNKEGADKERNRKIDIMRTVKCRVKTGEGIKKPLNLYSYDHSHSAEIDLQLAPDQIKAIEASISTPLCLKPKNPLDNNLNVNHVFVQDVFNLSLNKVNQGGFSTIYLSQVKYLCVYPTEGYEIFRPNSLELANSKNLLNKCVVIKMEDEEGGFSRNAHQLEILKKLRNVSSVFLPKYYLFINKPNPLGNAVAMDYIPYDNLKHYVRTHFPSLSLYTKLYLLLSTVHAVRLLRDNRIVHLDLKPNNIMLSSNLVVKLIDFGESYHPQVCAKRSPSGQLSYKPGFTIPYSSPQIFSNETKYYTSKSDVFSLGVIMFEVLYNCFPFDIFQTTEVIDQVMESYLNKWLLSPEECEGNGEAFILRTMNGIISKCLSPQTSVRPELDWMAVVIRNCLQLLY